MTQELESSDPRTQNRARTRAENLRRLLEQDGVVGAGPMTTNRAQALDARAIATLDRDVLASSLRALTAWLSGQGPDTGTTIDNLIAHLEQTMGPIMGQNPKHGQAKPDSRIRANVRTSIAARLREAGISTTRPALTPVADDKPSRR